MRRSNLTVLFVLLGAPAGVAQTSAPLHRAAATITAKDVARRVGIIADDSMLGRDTPSRGLDMTAQYVANQFRQFGLKPGGDQGSWFQRYSIARRRMLLDQSRVILSSGETADSAKFTTDVRYDGGGVPEQPLAAPAVLVSGAQTEASAAGAGVRDRIALYARHSARQTGEFRVRLQSQLGHPHRPARVEIRQRPRLALAAAAARAVPGIDPAHAPAAARAHRMPLHDATTTIVAPSRR